MSDRPQQVIHSAAAARARVAQGLLLALLLGMALAGRRSDYWPVITWPVYGTIRPVAPGPTWSVREVRVTTRAGVPVRLGVGDLVEQSRHRIADLALLHAVERREDQRFLQRLVEQALGEPLAWLEIWELTWPVDLRRNPPLAIDRPSSETRLVRFAAASTGIP